jgi:uncharacterized protein YdeI (YjbR/CyaY-like superfamily)
MNRHPGVDAYIKKSAPFAQPILTHVRELIHETLPDVEEAVKWGMPCFLIHGTLLGNLAAFKQYASFGFWKTGLMADPHKVFRTGEGGAAGSFGRLSSVKDLPSDKILREYIREAAKLNELGVKEVRKPRPAPKSADMPEFFKKALAKSKAAAAQFKKMSPSKQREYITWLADAKTEETRKKRLETAIEWISEGKSRNWKYEKKT